MRKIRQRNTDRILDLLGHFGIMILHIHVDHMDIRHGRHSGGRRDLFFGKTAAHLCGYSCDLVRIQHVIPGIIVIKMLLDLLRAFGKGDIVERIAPVNGLRRHHIGLYIIAAAKEHCSQYRSDDQPPHSLSGQQKKTAQIKRSGQKRFLLIHLHPPSSPQPPSASPSGQWSGSTPRLPYSPG